MKDDGEKKEHVIAVPISLETGQGRDPGWFPVVSTKKRRKKKKEEKKGTRNRGNDQEGGERSHGRMKRGEGVSISGLSEESVIKGNNNFRQKGRKGEKIVKDKKERHLLLRRKTPRNFLKVEIPSG